MGALMRILMQTLGGKTIADLQERDFTNLQTQTEDPGGFLTCSFEVAQRVDLPHDYRALIPTRIDEGASVVFDGFVAPAYPHPYWDDAQQGYKFQLVGWMQQLVDAKTRGMYLDAGTKASTFISDWIHGGLSAESPDKGDPRLQIVSGDIQTTDVTFSSPRGSDWDGKSWYEILADLNEQNLWSWGVYEDRALFWRPKTEQTDYYIWMADSRAEMDSGYENICDLVLFQYRPAFGESTWGFHPDEGWDPALTRVHRTHVLDGTGNLGWDDASAIAEAYYDYYSVPHVKGTVTATAVTNRLGAPVPLWSVRAGSRASLMGFNYWQYLDSFYIKRTTYDHDNQTLTLERDDSSPRLERLLATIKS